MGCASSTEILETALYNLPQPVAALNAVFCGSTPVTLHLREKAWTLSGDDFTIRDAHSGELYFRIEGSVFSFSDHKVLLDVANQPIAHMRNQILSFLPTFNICADRDGHRVLFTINSRVTFFDSELDVRFPNLINGCPVKVGILGDWRARAAVIWFDLGNGQHLPVARVYRPTTGRGVFLGAQDYYVDIAANVDKALMVLICVALDECKRD